MKQDKVYIESFLGRWYHSFKTIKHVEVFRAGGHVRAKAVNVSGVEVVEHKLSLSDGLLSWGGLTTDDFDRLHVNWKYSEGGEIGWFRFKDPLKQSYVSEQKFN